MLVKFFCNKNSHIWIHFHDKFLVDNNMIFSGFCSIVTINVLSGQAMKFWVQKVTVWFIVQIILIIIIIIITVFYPNRSRKNWSSLYQPFNLIIKFFTIIFKRNVNIYMIYNCDCVFCGDAHTLVPVWTPDGPRSVSRVSGGPWGFNVHLLMLNYSSRIAVKHTSLRLHWDTHTEEREIIYSAREEKNTHTLTHINAFQREFSRFDLQAKLVNTPQRALTDTRLHVEEKF